MNVSTVKEKNSLTLFLSGRVDTNTAREFELAVEDNIADVKELTFDLEGLDYVSSAGLRVFLKYQKAMDRVGGSMKITRVKQDVYEIFEMIGFSDIMTIERV